MTPTPPTNNGKVTGRIMQIFWAPIQLPVDQYNKAYSHVLTILNEEYEELDVCPSEGVLQRAGEAICSVLSKQSEEVPRVVEVLARYFPQAGAISECSTGNTNESGNLPVDGDAAAARIKATLKQYETCLNDWLGAISECSQAQGEPRTISGVVHDGRGNVGSDSFLASAGSPAQEEK